MLVMPSDSQSTASIVGIDPGSHNLGVGVITIDLNTLNIISCMAWTFAGEKLSRHNTWYNELHGDRAGRIFAHEENLLNIFNYYNPISVASEAPFINNRFPAAGLALTETVSGIRGAVFRYSAWHDLKMIPPSSVKNAVGAGGACGKDVMKEKITFLLKSNYIGRIPIELLDEHSIDALAVAYTQYKRMVTGYG